MYIKKFGDLFSKFVKFLCGKENSLNKNIFKVAIYITLGIIFIYKVNFYTDKVARFPDEIMHISYVAYLEESDKIIPSFKEMYSLNDDIDLNEDKTTGYFVNGYYNYLGHPPLYYNLLRLAGTASVKDDIITVNIELMRTISHIIGYLGMAVAFYIGFKKIRRLFLNLLFATIIVMVPMMSYSIAGVNNDTLCFLAINILLLGLIRFTEDKRGYLTYALVGVGVFTAVLTKLTAGLIVMIAGIIFIIYTIIKEKSFKIITCKEFIVTLPLYICVLLYYIYIYYKYGTIMPSLSIIDPEYFKTASYFYVKESERIHLNFGQYFEHFKESFIRSWSGIHSHVSLEKRDVVDDGLKAAYTSILILPILGSIVSNKDKVRKVFTYVYIGVVLAILYQFKSAHSAFINNGYLGGFQSRYYLCAIVSMAILVCYLVDFIIELIEKYIKNTFVSSIIKCIVVVGVLYFVYVLYIGDFPYFIDKFDNYLIR